MQASNAALSATLTTSWDAEYLNSILSPFSRLSGEQARLKHWSQLSFLTCAPSSIFAAAIASRRYVSESQPAGGGHIAFRSSSTSLASAGLFVWT